jgi:hypothetical protein
VGSRKRCCDLEGSKPCCRALASRDLRADHATGKCQSRCTSCPSTSLRFLLAKGGRNLAVGRIKIPPPVHRLCTCARGISGDVSRPRLRLHRRDRSSDRAGEWCWHPTCFRNRQEAALVKYSRTSAHPRLDVGDAEDDGGCHGESDCVLRSGFFFEKS